MTELANYVGGQWVPAGNGEWLERHNPADSDELVARYPAMSESDVDAAFAAAVEGFQRWRRTKILDRGRVLMMAAQILRERSAELARDISREMGKTRAEAEGEVTTAADFFEFYAGFARHSRGDVLADRRDDVFAYTRREPLGVVLLITPWNDPLLTPARKMGPALISGNSVVLKSASETPVSAHHLMRVLADAGLPPGVANTVSGPSSRIGDALVEHPAVAAISFTGSTDVGLRLSRQVAGRSVRLQTEMGGKNAALVFPDADLELTADTVVTAGFGQSGQRCTATSRLLVHEHVYSTFMELLADRVRKLRVGSGMAPSTEVGPLVSEGHLRSVLAAIDGARAEGATIVVGGTRMRGEEWDRGNFLAPTVITDVVASMPIWQEEVFGPAIAATRFANLPEAVAAANDTRYGLSASIFTRDLSIAHHAIEELQTGQVAVNLPSTGWDVHVPFGGFKESGSPFKEHGSEGIRFYTQVKSVALGYF